MDALPAPPDARRTVELVARLKAHDDQAWRELYALYRDELLCSIRLRLGPRLRDLLQTEDVLQSATLEAFRAIPRFEDRGPGSLRAFLHRVVLNKLRDRADTATAKKRAGAVPLTESLEAVVSGEPPGYRDAARWESIERALSRLPPDMRDAIVRRRFEGLSCAEAAELSGRSEVAERKLYSRAMARLAVLASPDRESPE